MSGIRDLATLILTLTLAVAPLVAQQATPAPEAETQLDQPAPDKTVPEGETPAAKSPAGKADNSGDSPFDYRSSEEISEDLSVSFPVDI